MNKSDIVILNKEEAEKLLDTECQSRLGISYREFISNGRDAKLSNPGAVHDIQMLQKIIEK